MKLCLQQQELSVKKASCVSKSIPRVKQLETHLYIQPGSFYAWVGKYFVSFKRYYVRSWAQIFSAMS